jgi:hypothetical protein
MSSGVTSALPIRLPPVGTAAGGAEAAVGAGGVASVGGARGAASGVASSSGVVGAKGGVEKNFFLKKLNMGPALEWLHSMKPVLVTGQVFGDALGTFCNLRK